MRKKSLTLPPGLRERSGKLHYRFMHAGRRYTGSTGYAATPRNVSAASRKLEQARAAVERGEEPRRLAPIRFSEASDEYLTWKRGEHPDHPATAQRIEVSMVSLRAHFGQQLLHTITGADVEAYKSWRRANKIKPVTLRHDLHALSGLFQYAVTRRWCLRSPMAEVSIPSDRGANRDHVVTRAEELVYFTAAQAVYPPFHDLTRLILLLGLRPAEALSITPADVDLERRQVRIVAGKTSAATRTLALTEEACEILRRRIAAASGPWMWQSERGARQMRIQPYHRRVLALTGLRFTVYELRHTFASVKAEQGVPLPTLAAILGHASLRTVGRYIHPSQAAMDAAMLDDGRGKIGTTRTTEQRVDTASNEDEKQEGGNRR